MSRCSLDRDSRGWVRMDGDGKEKNEPSAKRDAVHCQATEECRETSHSIKVRQDTTKAAHHVGQLIPGKCEPLNHCDVKLVHSDGVSGLCVATANLQVTPNCTESIPHRVDHIYIEACTVTPMVLGKCQSAPQRSATGWNEGGEAQGNSKIPGVATQFATDSTQVSQWLMSHSSDLY